MSGIVAAGGRHLVVFVADVVAHGTEPRAIDVVEMHLRRPQRVHLHDADEEDQTDPRMEHARDRCAAENDREPEQPRRPEGEAGEQQIDVGESGDPMNQALAKRIAQDVTVRKELFLMGSRLRSCLGLQGFQVFGFPGLRAEAQIVNKEADQAADHGDVA